jgi:hypothetical protein
MIDWLLVGKIKKSLDFILVYTFLSLFFLEERNFGGKKPKTL